MVIKVCSFCFKPWEEPGPDVWDGEAQRCADRDECRKRAFPTTAKRLSGGPSFAGTTQTDLYKNSPKIGDKP